jgi:hypothetical protein
VNKILVGKSERTIGFGSVDWIKLAQDWNQWLVLVNTVIHRR